MNCCHKPASAPTLEVQPKEWLKVGLAAAVAGQLMVFSLALNMSPPVGTTRLWMHSALALSCVVIFVLVGLPILKQSLSSLRENRISMEQLFLLGICGAFFSSLQSTLTGIGSIYYDVVGVLLAIYTLGSLLQQRKRTQALASAQALKREFDTCTLINSDGTTESVPVKDVQAGMLILVKPGMGIPVDGKVQKGTAFVSETPLTGEPFPVVKREGDSVLAGSQVVDHPLTILCQSQGEGRKLDNLLHLMEKARLNPSPSQRQADVIVSWFLPLVLLISILTFAYWSFTHTWQQGLFNALAVLVVACPCAMGLAIPVGLWNALTQLARHGIFTASGEWVERIAQVQCVVFDKTGTLSEEKLSLLDFVQTQDYPRPELQRWIASTQATAHHPIAQAFEVWSAQLHHHEQVLSVQTLAGTGIQAHIQTADYGELTLQLGNRNLLTPEDLSIMETLRASLAQQATHELFIKINGKLVGMAVLRETFRQSMTQAKQWLDEHGYTVHIMTGDRAESVAHLGWQNTHASLTPQQKTELIQAIPQKTLFVGDGINDAAAMSHAHVALAMSEGAHLAQDAAQAVLFGGNLQAVTRALEICRKTRSVIRTNLIFAGCYNCIGMSLAACGVLHPIGAALLMLGSSLLVTWRAAQGMTDYPDLPKPQIDQALHQ